MAVLPTPASPSSTGIVLGAAAENLNDPLDFVLAADDRVHFALARDFGQVAPKSLEGGRFDFAFFLGRFFRGRIGRAAGLGLLRRAAKLGSSSLRISWRVCSMSTSRFFKHPRGHAVAFAQQPEQNVLRADVSVVESSWLPWPQGPELS